MRRETRTRDKSKDNEDTTYTPPWRRARLQRMKERDSMEAKDTYWEESTTHITTNNTRIKEEIEAVIPAYTKGCRDLNPTGITRWDLSNAIIKTQ